MSCVTIISLISVMLLLINMSYNNDPGINIFLIVFLCLSLISNFLSKCNCQRENLDNTEPDIADVSSKKISDLTQNSETKTNSSNSKTKTDSESDKKKYLDIDKKFIDSLINENQIIVDNLKIKSIPNNFLFDIMYPVGCIVLTFEGKLPFRDGVGWNKLPGAKLIATTGKLSNYVTTSMNVNTPKMGKYFDDTYDHYNYNYDYITNEYKHLDTSKDNQAQVKVKLFGNNVMNHNHIVYVDYQRSGYSGNRTGMPNGKYHSFAIVGGGDDNQKNRCVPNNKDGQINTNDPENYEVFPSRSTVKYTDNKDITKRTKIEDKNVKEHSNIPRYVLVYAFERVK